MEVIDAMVTTDSSLQQLASTPSPKVPWEKPRISLFEAACTAGDAKAASGNEATAQGPS
jgi:hypothetical protein